jgi:hypothetical protein
MTQSIAVTDWRHSNKTDWLALGEPLPSDRDRMLEALERGSRAVHGAWWQPLW